MEKTELRCSVPKPRRLYGGLVDARLRCELPSIFCGISGAIKSIGNFRGNGPPHTLSACCTSLTSITGFTALSLREDLQSPDRLHCGLTAKGSLSLAEIPLCLPNGHLHPTICHEVLCKMLGFIPRCMLVLGRVIINSLITEKRASPTLDAFSADGSEIGDRIRLTPLLRLYKHSNRRTCCLENALPVSKSSAAADWFDGLHPTWCNPVLCRMGSNELSIWIDGDMAYMSHPVWM